MKGISQRVSDHVSGSFLSDDDIEITDAIYKRDSFEVDEDGGKKVIERTVAALEVLVEGKDEPFTKTYALGNVLRPSEDGLTESDEGPFLVAAEGQTSKGVSSKSTWGKFQAALAVACKFPDANWDRGIRKALSGLKGHTTVVQGEKYKGKGGGDIPVFASIDPASIPNGKVSKAASKIAEKVAVKKGKPAPEPEPEEEDSESVESRVKAIIAKKAVKGPVTKAQLSTVMNTKFEDTTEKREAVKLAISSDFLKAGAAEGLWSYDGRQVSAAEAEEEEDNE